MNTKMKKTTYLVLWVITGVLFAILVGAIIEGMSYWVLDRLSLTAVLYGVLVTIGFFAGIIIGPKAWKMIYIDGARGKKYVVKENE
jgi:hypothetical protein